MSVKHNLYMSYIWCKDMQSNSVAEAPRTRWGPTDLYRGENRRTIPVEITLMTRWRGGGAEKHRSK